MANRYDTRCRKGQAPCPSCHRGLWWVGKGRRPERCFFCTGRKPRTKKKLVPVPDEKSEQTDRRSARARAEKRSEIAGWEIASLRLAVGLGIYPDDLERASRLAGVVLPDADGKPRPPTPAELDDLAVDARGPAAAPLREGRQEALTGLVQRFGLLNALSMIAEEPRIPAQQRPFAARMAQQLVKDLGGFRAVYPQINVSLGRKRSTKGKKR